MTSLSLSSDRGGTSSRGRRSGLASSWASGSLPFLSAALLFFFVPLIFVFILFLHRCQFFLFNLSLFYFLLLQFQESRRDPSNVFLCTQQKGPQLSHKFSSIFSIQEPSQVNLHHFGIWILHFQLVEYEFNYYIILKSKNFCYSFCNPRLNHLQIYFAHVYLFF